MDDVNGIIERAEERQKRLEKMIEKMMDKSEPILKAGMTNEQWLRQASTEELAEWLFRHCDCIECPARRQICLEKYENCKIAFGEWLKEKHN